MDSLLSVCVSIEGKEVSIDPLPGNSMDDDNINTASMLPLHLYFTCVEAGSHNVEAETCYLKFSQLYILVKVT